MKKSLLLVLALGGCTDVETATIAPYRVPCVGEGQYACLSATTDDGEEKRFYEGIDGFEFVWGQTQRVTRRRTFRRTRSPRMDLPSCIDSRARRSRA